MKNAEIKFKFTTPALLAGADPQSVEMRTSSVKGVLRWWCRNLGYDDKAIFGHAEGNSGQRGSITIRDLTEAKISPQLMDGEQICGNKFDYFLWPFRQDKNKRGVIMPNHAPEFHLSLSVQNNREELAETIIKAFLLLGSLGTRSRRAYGSIWPTSAIFDEEEWKIPQTTQELKTILSEVIQPTSYCVVLKIDDRQNDYKSAINRCSAFLKTFRCGSGKSGTPLQWGQSDHDMINSSQEFVYRAAIGLPLVQRYSNGRMFETFIDGFDRLASPILFKVIKLDGGFVPIATIFTSNTAADDSPVIWKEKGPRGDGIEKNTKVSLELLDIIAYPENHKKYWSKSSILGVFYP